MAAADAAVFVGSEMAGEDCKVFAPSEDTPPFGAAVHDNHGNCAEFAPATQDFSEANNFSEGFF